MHVSQIFLKASAASDLRSRKYTHAYRVKSFFTIMMYFVPSNEGIILRPLRSTKTLPSFFVTRDVVLLAIGLRYPLAMEHPVHVLNLPSSSTSRDFAASLNKNSFAWPCTQWKTLMSAVVSCKVALPGGYHRARQGKSMGRLHRVLVREGQTTEPFSLTRVSTTGGFNRKLQGSRLSRLHDVLDGYGNQQAKGDVVVIGINPSTMIAVSRSITSKLKTPIR